jgi:uncharacterized protein YdeI (YjbR/CyaY-like superfamily)
MKNKSAAVDAYINKAAPFARPILKHVRKLVHTGCPDVTETIKWSMPFFEHKGNLAYMAAFKEHCSFGLWKGSRLSDSKLPREEEGMGHFGRITKLSDLPDDKTLLGYVRQIAELNERGVKEPRAPRPKRKSQPLIIPDGFASALARNAKARKTFEGFSNSHRREYVEWITEAKRDETRRRRLTTAIEWLAAGKPRMWKYLKSH